jgi:methionine-rich copper-binding protein CopC
MGHPVTTPRRTRSGQAPIPVVPQEPGCPRAARTPGRPDRASPGTLPSVRPPSQPSNIRPRPLLPRPIAAATIASLLLAALLPGIALGHVSLVSSDPRDGATLDVAPDQVRVSFSEPLVAGKSSFKLVGPGGTVGTGHPDGTNPAALVLDTPGLAPGAYEVQWTAAGGDGHLERGTLEFTVLEPTPPPTPSPTPSPEATPTEAPSAPATPIPTATPAATPPVSAGPSAGPGDDGQDAASGGDLVLPIAVSLVLVVGLGGLLLRRSRAA